MYQVFNHAHQGLAMLSVLLTIGWAAVVLFAPRVPDLGRVQRLVYVGAMASTGLAGLSGLVLVALESGWLTMLFPWLGLAAVAGHGICGKRSRKALVAQSRVPALALALVALQLLLLIAAYGLMTVKPV